MTSNRSAWGVEDVTSSQPEEKKCEERKKEIMKEKEIKEKQNKKLHCPRATDGHIHTHTRTMTQGLEDCKITVLEVHVYVRPD